MMKEFQYFKKMEILHLLLKFGIMKIFSHNTLKQVLITDIIGI